LKCKKCEWRIVKRRTVRGGPLLCTEKKGGLSRALNYRMLSLAKGLGNSVNFYVSIKRDRRITQGGLLLLATRGFPVRRIKDVIPHHWGGEETLLQRETAYARATIWRMVSWRESRNLCENSVIH